LSIAKPPDGLFSTKMPRKVKITGHMSLQGKILILNHAKLKFVAPKKDPSRQ